MLQLIISHAHDVCARYAQIHLPHTEKTKKEQVHGRLFIHLPYTCFICDRMYARHIHKEQQQLHMVPTAVKSLSHCTSQ